MAELEIQVTYGEEAIKYFFESICKAYGGQTISWEEFKESPTRIQALREFVQTDTIYMDNFKDNLEDQNIDYIVQFNEGVKEDEKDEEDEDEGDE